MPFLVTAGVALGTSSLSVVAAVISVLSMGTLDWSAGLLRARAALASSVDAPNVDIARARAERLARKLLVERMAALIGEIPLAPAGTLSKRLEKSSSLRRQVEVVAQEVEVIQVDYHSEGGVQLEGSLPLGKVERLFERRTKPKRSPKPVRPSAATGDTVPTSEARGAASEAEPTGYVVIWREAGRPQFLPGLDVRYYDDLPSAKNDGRLGTSPKVVEVGRFGPGLGQVGEDETEALLDKPMAVVMAGASVAPSPEAKEPKAGEGATKGETK